MNFEEIFRKTNKISMSVVEALEKNKYNTLFIRNLDDFVPTLSYMGYEKFLKEKVTNLLNSDFLFRGLYCSKRPFCYSWQNDEWLGGNLYLKENYSFRKSEILIDSFLNTFSETFLEDGRLASLSVLLRDNAFPIPLFNPRTGAIIEELIKLNNRPNFDLDEKYGINIKKILENSFENRYFLNKGLFPKITYFGNLQFLNCLSNDQQNLISFPSKKFSPFIKVYKPAKENSSMLHALNLGIKVFNSNKLEGKLKYFLKNINDELINKRGFVSTSSTLNQVNDQDYRLSMNHPIIEGFCDSYFFHIKDKKLLNIVETIANAWLHVRFPNKLFPYNPNSNISWLDDQIDVAICFGRLYELTRKEEYIDLAIETIDSVFEIHYSTPKRGLVEKVDKRGNIIDSTINPKYNALAIKAWIFLNEVILKNKEIYKDKKVYEILKDR